MLHMMEHGAASADAAAAVVPPGGRGTAAAGGSNNVTHPQTLSLGLPPGMDQSLKNMNQEQLNRLQATLKEKLKLQLQHHQADTQPGVAAAAQSAAMMMNHNHHRHLPHPHSSPSHDHGSRGTPLNASSAAAAAAPAAMALGVGDNGGKGAPPPMDIFDAVKLGIISMTKRLIENPPESLEVYLKRRDADGHTIMHWAAKRGDYEVVKYLADKGAPMFSSSEDGVGMQPIHWAITDGHLPVLHYLVSKGADIDARDKQLCTPLLIAAQYGQTEAVVYLIKNGADTSLLDINHDSAMHWAAYKGELSIVQLLNNLSLPTESIDGYGQSPLHLASLRGNLPVVEYLVLETDASTAIKDKTGATPLDLAIKKGKKHVAAFLRSQSKDAFNWRQLLDWNHWQEWMQGGGNAEASSWPFHFVILTNLWVACMYPLRFFTEEGLIALGDYGLLHACCVGLQFGMWVFFLLAYKSDPGFLNGKADSTKKEYHEALESFSSQGMEAMMQQGAIRKLTLCHSCHVKRPVRSKHCRVCRKCVKVFDHHCPFIGNCVGLHNYRWFFAYVVSVFFAALLFVITCFLYLRKAGFDPLGLLSLIYIPTIFAALLFVITCFLYLRLAGFDPFVLLSLVYILIMCIMVGLLAFYHVQLMAANLTTNEHHNFLRYDYLKDAQGQARNPFEAGCLRNVASQLLSPHPTTNRFPFRSIYLPHTITQDAQGQARNPFDAGCLRNVASRLLSWEFDESQLQQNSRYGLMSLNPRPPHIGHGGHGGGQQCCQHKHHSHGQQQQNEDLEAQYEGGVEIV